MEIKIGAFYKAKAIVDGKATPGGYLYVDNITEGKVIFTPVKHPDDISAELGSFKIDVEVFLKLIEDDTRH